MTIPTCELVLQYVTRGGDDRLPKIVGHDARVVHNLVAFLLRVIHLVLQNGVGRQDGPCCGSSLVGKFHTPFHGDGRLHTLPLSFTPQINHFVDVFLQTRGGEPSFFQRKGNVPSPTHPSERRFVPDLFGQENHFDSCALSVHHLTERFLCPGRVR